MTYQEKKNNKEFEEVIKIDKRSEKLRTGEDKKKVSTRRLVEEIQKNSREELLPTLKKKTEEIGEKIYHTLEEKGAEKVSNIQIMSMIASRSNLDIMNAGSYVSYTPQEIAIAFNLYLEMINKINEIKQFPPTVESFCLFLGISTTSYNNWLVDSDKKATMDYIQSYMLGVLSTGSLVGDLKEISSIYQQKVLGKIEQQQPQIVKHEITTSQDEIISQLQALKKERVIDATYEDKE